MQQHWSWGYSTLRFTRCRSKEFEVCWKICCNESLSKNLSSTMPQILATWSHLEVPPPSRRLIRMVMCAKTIPHKKRRRRPAQILPTPKFCVILQAAPIQPSRKCSNLNKYPFASLAHTSNTETVESQLRATKHRKTSCEWMLFPHPAFLLANVATFCGDVGSSLRWLHSITPIALKSWSSGSEMGRSSWNSPEPS